MLSGGNIWKLISSKEKLKFLSYTIYSSKPTQEETLGQQRAETDSVISTKTRLR